MSDIHSEEDVCNTIVKIEQDESSTLDEICMALGADADYINAAEIADLVEAATILVGMHYGTIADVKTEDTSEDIKREYNAYEIDTANSLLTLSRQGVVHAPKREPSEEIEIGAAKKFKLEPPAEDVDNNLHVLVERATDNLSTAASGNAPASGSKKASDKVVKHSGPVRRSERLKSMYASHAMSERKQN